MSRADDEKLLHVFSPWVCYDSRESYRADSPAVMTDLVSELPQGGRRATELRDAHGSILATADASRGAPRLDLGFLGTRGGDDHDNELLRVHSSDYPGDARRMHANAEFADRVYGRVQRSNDRTWLQYWFFYLYNSRPLDDHEGDWEMIQIELDGKDRPQSVTYGQHRHARTRHWNDDDVEKRLGDDGEQAPVVYPGFGSHCALFGKGSWQWVGVFDCLEHNDGGSEPIRPRLLCLADMEWAKWPGRWGSTLERIAKSPRGPAYQGERWSDPAAFHDNGKNPIHLTVAFPEQSGAAPLVAWRREGESLSLRYDAQQTLVGRHWLRATILPEDGDRHPLTYTFPLENVSGELKLPLRLAGAGCQATATSVDTANRESESTPIEHIR